MKWPPLSSCTLLKREHWVKLRMNTDFFHVFQQGPVFCSSSVGLSLTMQDKLSSLWWPLKFDPLYIFPPKCLFVQWFGHFVLRADQQILAYCERGKIIFNIDQSTILPAGFRIVADTFSVVWLIHSTLFVHKLMYIASLELAVAVG